MATGIILAGGRSSRFGSDKAWALLDGRPLLAHVAAALGGDCDDLVVVCRRDQPLPPTDVTAPLTLAFDAVEGEGPLAGLVAGLEAAADDACFVASCDAPLLQPQVVRLLLAKLPGHAAVVPIIGGREQPLAAAYDRSVAVDALRAAFETGVRRLSEAVMSLHPLVVSEDEVRAVDARLWSFANVNDPAELAALAARRFG